MQSHQDDNYEALETFAEQVYVFLTLLALQRRLNCDEMWVLEHAALVTAQVHPESGVPRLRHIARLEA